MDFFSQTNFPLMWWCWCLFKGKRKFLINFEWIKTTCIRHQNNPSWKVFLLYSDSPVLRPVARFRDNNRCLGQSWPLLKIECPYSASLRFHKLSSLFAWKENFDSICFVRISYAKQIQCASIFLKCGICSTIAIIVRSDCQIVTYMNESSHRTDLLSHLI